MQKSSLQDANFTKPRRVLFLTGLALLVLIFAFISVYRFTAPTDGWAGTDSEIPSRNGGGWMLQDNVMGASSELRAGDVIVAVEGVPYQDISPGTIPTDEWRIGRTIQYTIQRDDRQQVIEVPLVHWDVAHLLTTGSGLIVNLSVVLSTVLLMGIGVVVFWKRSDSQAARSMALLTTILAVTATTDLPARSMADTVDLTSSLMIIAQYTLLYTALIPPILIHFTLVFPEPKPIVLRHAWLQALPFGFGVLMIIPFALTNGAAGWLWVAAAMVISIALLIHTAITRRDPVSRAQLRWAVGGFVGGLLMILLGFPAQLGLVAGPMKTILDAISAQGLTLLGVCLAIAILRYRLFDIDLIIRRTVTYSVITALLAGVYFGTVTLLQSLFTGLVGSESPLAIVISTLAIAALFNPVRQRVQNFVDRRFNRSKYNAEKTLEAFAESMRDDVDMDHLSAALVGVVNETMQPESVALWMPPPRKNP